ncbi:uncharacterized protein LOC135692396 isoform X2 [Rhopilema esculentum]|uniref:uncharacterized protein LOC135692396 isoform X2 n=1 Tax=Rhopilema esculentum TaxID=499914 RepID=UPI0031DC2D32
MPRKVHEEGECQLSCLLCRSGRQSISTLERAEQRKVEWPSPTLNPPDFKDPHSFTTIDDAFGTVMQFMSMTTSQCKRYYRSKNRNLSEEDNKHCQQFHTHQQKRLKDRNPLQQHEGVQLEMAPGTYAVSAGKWGAERSHTHVVHISPGQTIDLTFGI